MTRTFLLAAMTLAIGLCAVIGFAPDAFAAGITTAATADPSWSVHLLAHASVALVALRATAGDLRGKIDAKSAEIKDDTAAADRKRIEGEHDALVALLEDVNRKIVVEEAKPAADPVDAPAVRAQALTEERARTAAIRTIGDSVKVERTFVDEHITTGTTVDAFRAALLDKLAKSEANTAGPNGSSAVRVEVVGDDELEKRGQAMQIALLHRFDPKRYEKEFVAAPLAREYRGYSLIEMARDALESAGHRTRGLSKMEIADAALSMRTVGTIRNGQVSLVTRAGGSLSTSDFANILANVLNKTLRDGYQATPQTFRSLVRETTVPDFKQVSRTQLGEAPQLERVNEHGEFKRGKMGDAAEKYAIGTYGKVVAITRQVIINDDLEAMTRLPRQFGVQAANLESDLVWYQILKNANMSDGVALFNATHGNLGTAGVISVTTVNELRVLSSKQTGVDGKTLINVELTYLVVPKALQTSAEQFRSQLYPATVNNVVPDSMRQLGIIAEPRLDTGVTIDVGSGADAAAGSATHWYMAGDVNQIDIIELAYLQGAPGLFTETRMGFDVDGMEVKVRLDVGAKVIDWRGLAQNPN